MVAYLRALWHITCGPYKYNAKFSASVFGQYSVVYVLIKRFLIYHIYGKYLRYQYILHEYTRSIWAYKERAINYQIWGALDWRLNLMLIVIRASTVGLLCCWGGRFRFLFIFYFFLLYNALVRSHIFNKLLKNEFFHLMVCFIL